MTSPATGIAAATSVARTSPTTFRDGRCGSDLYRGKTTMNDDEKDDQIKKLQAENKELREALNKALAACEIAHDSAREAKASAANAEENVEAAIQAILWAL